MFNKLNVNLCNEVIVIVIYCQCSLVYFHVISLPLILLDILTLYLPINYESEAIIVLDWVVKIFWAEVV